jgi:hypothetical protein
VRGLEHTCNSGILKNVAPRLGSQFGTLGPNPLRSAVRFNVDSRSLPPAEKTLPRTRPGPVMLESVELVRESIDAVYRLGIRRNSLF